MKLGDDTMLSAGLYEGIYCTINVLIGVSCRDLDPDTSFSFRNNWVGESDHIDPWKHKKHFIQTHVFVASASIFLRHNTLQKYNSDIIYSHCMTSSNLTKYPRTFGANLL